MTTVEQIIKDYKLNQAVLATHLGIHQTTFTEKLNLRRYSKFTPDQREQLKSYLKGLSKDINSL